MGKNTNIEWADHTFNPWIGCAKVSDGCKFCYAETLQDTRWKKVKWGIHGTRVLTSESNWKKPLQWNAEAAKKGVREKVFCASLADVFEDRDDLYEWRNEDLYKLILATPHLDWLILTKRPENINKFWGFLFPENVWFGTSVENQAAANERIPHLLQLNVKVRFLSMEPLLGPVDLMAIDHPNEKFSFTNSLLGTGFSHNTGGYTLPYKIDWVIVGGESGHNARPMHPDWARSLRDQCKKAGTAFFFKQWGEWKPFDPADEPFSDIALLNAEMVKVGKKAAGAQLDGKEHKKFPIL
jgi:protein gp37